MQISSDGIFELVKNQARGQWPLLFDSLGIQTPPKGKQGPCPCCGGTDRFTFDDKYNDGNWFCRQCDPHSGDGIALVANVFGLSPLDSAKKLAHELGIDTSYQLNIEEIEKLRAEVQRKREKQEQQRLEQDHKRLTEGSHKAQWVLDNYCQPASENQPYIKRKQIKPYNTYILKKPFKNAHNPEARFSKGTMFPEGTLVIPIYGEHGVKSLEFIPEEDKKKGLIGAEKRAGFFPFGVLAKATRIWISEGFADAATIYEQAGDVAVCAFSAGNIQAVANLLKKLYPKAEILIAADNDPTGTKAAKATGLPYSMPEQFKQDWSAFYLNGGDIKKHLEANIIYPPKPVERLPADEARPKLSRVAQIVFNREHPELNQPFSHTIIKGAAGLGKTTIIVALAKSLPRGQFIEYYCQSIEFAEEVAEKCKEQGVSAAVVRGRDQRINDKPMCRRAKAANELGKAGLPVYSSLCKNKDGECPYFQACPYIDQLKGQETVKIYPTQRFAMDRGNIDRLEKIPVVAVVDESFYQVLTVHTKVEPEKIKQSCISSEAKNIIDNWINTRKRPEWCDTLSEALKDVSKTFDRPPISPTASDSEINLAVSMFKPERAMYALLNALNPGTKENPKEVYKADTKVVNNEWISVTGTRPITRFDYKLEGKSYRIPLINLDASADADIVRAVTNMSWNLIEINAKREGVTFTHINKSFSKATLGLIEGNNDTAKANAEALRGDALKFVEKIAQKHERVLLVTYKALEDVWQGKLPPNVDTEHFGNLRGKDAYKNHDALIQIGRNQPSPLDVEIKSRQIFRATTGHKNQIERQIRDTETEQSVDRLRLIGNEKPRHVYLLTNHLPDSIQPDKVMSWPEAKGTNTQSEQLVEKIISRFGGVPLSGKFLSEYAPELVGNSENARKVLSRKIKPELVKSCAGQSLISIYIRKCHAMNLTNRLIEFRVSSDYCPVETNSKLSAYGYELVPEGDYPQTNTEYDSHIKIEGNVMPEFEPVEFEDAEPFCPIRALEQQKDLAIDAEDKKLVLRMLNGAPSRIKREIVHGYIEVWRLTKQAEPLGHRKEVCAQYAANVWLRREIESRAYA